MLEIIQFILVATGMFIVWGWLFFLLYIGAMGILRAHKDGHFVKANGSHNLVLYLLCAPFMIVAWLYDFFSNVLIISLVYIEPPTQLTYTARLKTHIHDTGWRGDLSRFVCQKLLSPFDPSGDHCD